MQYIDCIGIQINIDDDWPVDKGARKKLRQCSDFIEIVNDLNECLRIIETLEKLTREPEHEFCFMKDLGIPPIPRGTLIRSLDSAFYSKYGRCFNSSDGRVTFDSAASEKIFGEELFGFHTSLLSIRNEIIAHADDVSGRQPIRVINWEAEKSNWDVDTSTAIDSIPQWNADWCETVKLCCEKVIEHCNQKKQEAWKSFRGMLSEDEAQAIRQQHYTNDESGSGYPVEPPASTRE